MKKISIIIPIYNAEKYLKECLDSVITQDYQNIEAILVNDGSTDNSRSICEEYEKKDKRIKFLEQKNQGVSAARNFALKKATGDIIVFLDADDYFEQNAIKNIVESIGENDFLCFGYKEVYTNRTKRILKAENINDKKTIKDSIMENDGIGGYLWNKAFKSKIIKDNNILFRNDIHFCEDLVFVMEYFKYVKNALYIRKPLYNYRMRKSGATYNFFNKKSLSILIAYEKLIKEKFLSDKYEKIYMYWYIMTYYKLKKVAIEESFEPNEEIISKEKDIYKQQKIKERIKFVVIKYFPSVFRIFIKQKLKKLRLFD